MQDCSNSSALAMELLQSCTKPLKFHVPFQEASGAWFNIKMTSYQYRKSHCGDKTILRPSYLHNGISYTGKTTSLYWIRPLGDVFHSLWRDNPDLVKMHFLLAWNMMLWSCHNFAHATTDQDLNYELINILWNRSDLWFQYGVHSVENTCIFSVEGICLQELTYPLSNLYRISC